MTAPDPVGEASHPTAANEAPPVVVAIDGPSGSGKSTIARALAAHIDVAYLDTGAMYRAVTWLCLDHDVDLSDEAAATALAEAMILERTADGKLLVNGRDATAVIRSAEVTAAVSQVSAHPGVREEMRVRQRAWATERGGGIMEGRDIGTVVFPDATLKVYLVADAAVRAARRAAQTGQDAAVLEAEMRRRDAADSTRDVAPLRAADDSVEVDTSHRTIEEVVDVIAALVAERSHPTTSEASEPGACR